VGQGGDSHPSSVEGTFSTLEGMDLVEQFKA
jgi:hypothetical protein